MSNYPKWRYVADGQLPGNGYEECFVEDAFGHRFTAEYNDHLLFDWDENDDPIFRDNVFVSNVDGQILPNEIVRWIPLKEIVIVTEVKEDISND